nr:protein WVD2-like 4 [Tanacetum cinerariifolium]
MRERKFVVAKRASKSKSSQSVECKCGKGSDGVNMCLCVAYERLRASQEEFFKVKSENEVENDDVSVENEDEGEEGVETLGDKRRREKVVEVKRRSIPEPGSGKVMDLVKAFESKLNLPNEEDEAENEEGTRKSDQFSMTSFGEADLLLTAENLGLGGARVSSSLDSNHGSVLNRNSGDGSRPSRRNSSESSASFGGRRWKRRARATYTYVNKIGLSNKASLSFIASETLKIHFVLVDRQRGRSKQEEFMKKVKEMMVEQEKQRIPIAQPLPLTTDEPECLVKPPVKESTKPVDVVLHSDVRAVERSEFDQQVQAKLSYIEQYKLEREKEQQLEEEEELKRLRKELIPIAQPMPYFDRPFIPRRSEKQPTIPKEPKFHNPQHKKIKCCMFLNDVHGCVNSNEFTVSLVCLFEVIISLIYVPKLDIFCTQ